MAFAHLHLWTADAQTGQERAGWSKKLGAMAALQQAIVVPSHVLSGQQQMRHRTTRAKPI
jgi:hypothetical protein